MATIVSNLTLFTLGMHFKCSSNCVIVILKFQICLTCVKISIDELLFPLMHEFKDWTLASLAYSVHDPQSLTSTSLFSVKWLDAVTAHQTTSRCDWISSASLWKRRVSLVSRCRSLRREPGSFYQLKEGAVANYHGKQALLTSAELFYSWVLTIWRTDINIGNCSISHTVLAY